MSSRSIRLDARALRDWCHACLMRVGMSPDDALTVADNLVYADLRGTESHGVIRLGIYLERLRRRLVDPCATPRVVSQKGGTALIDGCNGMGQVVGVFAMDKAIELARAHGTSAVGVRRSNHYGVAAYYVERAISAGMIAFAYTNASPTMAPWGGTQPYLGTNPYAFGVPAGRYGHVLLDMATSVVSRGRIMVAKQQAHRIPEGWAISAEGRPTRDPDEALQGTVLPLGGHKGYGLALMIDLMAGVLTGAGFGRRVGNLYDLSGPPQDVGVYFQVVDVESFMPLEAFVRRVEEMITEIKAIPPAPGVEGILLPGERERRIARERELQGIPVPLELLGELEAIGAQLGLTPPLTERAAMTDGP